MKVVLLYNALNILEMSILFAEIVPEFCVGTHAAKALNTAPQRKGAGSNPP